MRYGLVSSPVLGFDLARHARGPLLARVLRYGVGATAEHVAALAAVQDLPFPGRPDRLALAHLAGERAAGSQGGLDLARVALDAGDTASAVRLLETGLLGDLGSLLSFVSEQVAGECWAGHPGATFPPADAGLPASALDRSTHAAAAETLADAVVGAWVGTAGGASSPAADALSCEAARLLAPFRQVSRELPPLPLEVADQTAAVRAALQRLADLTPADCLRLAEVGGAASAGGAVGEWAKAVHEVSWAVHATGRTEIACCVQLDAVDAVRSAGLDVPAAATGAWNVVSGALHALVVADALPVDIALLAPWEDALGPLPTGA